MSSLEGVETKTLLVGGVALPTAEDVFRSVAATLGDRVGAVPDGETGPRTQWIIWQFAVLEAATGLKRVSRPPEMYGPWDRYALEDGATTADIEFPELGYAEAALDSYGVFARLQADGEIPDSWRFQVSLPTPAAVTTVFVVPGSQAEVHPAYEAAMIREVERICAGVPYDRLAIQWDVCWEIAYLEGLVPPFWEGDVLEGSVERVAVVAGVVPADVELGLHLCYGSYRNEHFLEPRNAEVMVNLSNRLVAAIDRPVHWLHMPVPIDRSDEAYFRPLENLKLGPETELFLGVVHFEDGVDGAQRRIAAAQTTVARFGIACECGMARVPPKWIPGLLQIHRDARLSASYNEER